MQILYYYQISPSLLYFLTSAEFLLCQSEARSVFNAVERVGADILVPSVPPTLSQPPR
jgi:hypothetical protein